MIAYQKILQFKRNIHNLCVKMKTTGPQKSCPQNPILWIYGRKAGNHCLARTVDQSLKCKWQGSND